MKKEPRHYCIKCSAKRNESAMKKIKRSAFGRFTWQCNKCGDSRFGGTVKRTDGGMKFSIKGTKK